MLWMKLNQGEEEEGLVLAVYYVPPESSSRERSSEEYFQTLAEQVAKFGVLGPVVMCGDFNARCVELMEDPKALPRRHVLDIVKNRQAEDLMYFLGNTGMRIVNGRSGRGSHAYLGEGHRWLTIVLSELQT